MTKLALRHDARRDLDQIDAYSIDRFGDDVARAYMEEIRRALNRLRDYPQSGALLTDVHPPIRYVGCGSHRIFYDYFENDDLVAVVRVLHRAMSHEHHLNR